MIFVDSNVAMYLVGRDEAMRVAARTALQRIAGTESFVTSAEVFQEILHRYKAIDRTDAIQPAFDVLLGITQDVFAVDLEDVERAKRVLLERPALSARDALHVAVMLRRRVARILSFDAGFDGVAGIERIT